MIDRHKIPKTRLAYFFGKSPLENNNLIRQALPSNPTAPT